MDKIQTITQVTKSLGISTRMLRYYEQLVCSKASERKAIHTEFTTGMPAGV